MTEQSPASDRASYRDGEDFLSRARRERAALDPVQPLGPTAQLVVAALSVPQESTMNTSPSRCSSYLREEERKALRAEWARVEAQLRWRDAEVPERHAKKVKALCQSATGSWFQVYTDLRARLGSGLLVALVGARGTGKTQLAACLIADVVEERSARYIKAPELFRVLRECFGPATHESENEVVTRFSAYSLLVIDATEERGQTSFEDRTLACIVDQRYDRELDTLLLSNETRAEFAQGAGSSILSRMTECGGVIECDWPSFRGC